MVNTEKVVQLTVTQLALFTHNDRFQENNSREKKKKKIHDKMPRETSSVCLSFSRKEEWLHF